MHHSINVTLKSKIFIVLISFSAYGKIQKQSFSKLKAICDKRGKIDNKKIYKKWLLWAYVFQRAK